MCYICMDSHVQCTYVRTHSMLVIILFVSYSLERFGGQPVEQKEQTIIFTEGSQSFAESKLFTCTYVYMFFIVVVVFVSDCIRYTANWIKIRICLFLLVYEC